MAIWERWEGEGVGGGEGEDGAVRWQGGKME